ncbi:MAG TPA: SAM-dependent methyltransferase, partial [Candidatus Paceibacterota bacterium]|nr:SAM-dependent methyltransferase [Candidatus Paceibacterota bacterium]
VTAAFSIAGIPGNAFTFLGFAPQKKGRATFFKRLAAYEVPVIFYESPHRIAKALESLAAELPTDFRVTVARELTKLHEEVIAGSPAEVRDYFTEHPDRVRGEFVIIVSRG